MFREKVKEKEPINFIYLVKRIYPMCFKVNPAYLIFSRSSSMLLFIIIGANIVSNQILFDAIYNASIGISSLKYVLIAFAFYVFLKFANDIMYAINYFTWGVQTAKIIGFMNMEINKKSALIDPVEYENPERLDDINKALNGAGAAVKFLSYTTGVLTRYVSFLFLWDFIWQV